MWGKVKGPRTHCVCLTSAPLQAAALETLKRTPQSPKTDVPPLDKPLQTAPALRGSARRREGEGEDATPDSSGCPAGGRIKAACVQAACAFKRLA